MHTEYIHRNIHTFTLRMIGFSVSPLGWLALSLMVGIRGDKFTMSVSSLLAVAPTMGVGIACVITAGGCSEVNV